jgi:hypothetical protein
LVPSAQKAILAHCLVNLDGEAYQKMQERLAYQYNAINGDNDEYIKACIKLEKQFIYDLPKFMKDNSYIEIIIERDDATIERMHGRVIECRDWMNENWENI